nr:LOW QUALITY PROTEIN: DNA-directed RNA polymerase, mitochondrial [Cavia porcellus]
MAALRWGRGAAGLSWALRSPGRPCTTTKEGILDGLWGPRLNSSASPCEQERRKDWGHVELLEVLEARVRQLQAESVSEVTVKRVEVARVPADGGKAGGTAPPAKARVQPSGAWARKLERDRQLLQRQQALLKEEARGRSPLPAPRPKPSVKAEAKAKGRPKPEAMGKAVARSAAALEGKAKHSAGCVLPPTEPQPESQQYGWMGLEPQQGTWEHREWERLQPWETSLLPCLPPAASPPPGSGSSAQASSELRAKEKAQQNRLQTFLEGCLATGQVGLAHHMLVCYFTRPRRQRLLVPAMFNTVMRGWAQEGSYKELVSVLIMMRHLGFAPDLLSYTSILQCMGRVDQDVTTIRRCLQQMARDGLQLEQLFSEESLSPEERAALLRAVLKAKPNFRLPQPCPQVSPVELLQEVYAKDGPVSYPRLHLPLAELQALFRQQLHVELAGSMPVESVEKVSPTQEILQARKNLAALRKTWEAELHSQLRATKANLAQRSRRGTVTLYPFLCVLPEEELVQILLQVLFSLPAQGEPFVHTAHRLALQTFQRHILRQRSCRGHLQALEQRYAKYLGLLASDTQVAEPCLPRQHWEALGPPEPPPPQPWPLLELLLLGKLLLETLVQVTRLPASLASQPTAGHSVPVLFHVYTFRGVRQIGLLRPHPAFVRLVEQAKASTLTFEATDMPMLCPPLPWSSSQAGGFLLSPIKLMGSLGGPSSTSSRLESCPPAQLHGALEALTQLGNCAWRVNGRLLDLVLEVFLDKGCCRLGVPPPVSEAPRPPLDQLAPDTQPHLKAQLRQEVARCLKVAREMHGLRQEALYRLSLAQHLRDRVFWLPHNMDFRGRTYPCPPHFNHLGSDLARALLEFAQGRPLGPRGLDWLKIHLVNLTGLKKREPLHARLSFADAMMDDILDSAERPMTGRKWWMEADDPWQTLACCMEVARAVQSPDPAAYVSHLPVHQDGSCNGLQHYAALGRDSVGAASVNLASSDVPQDVYSGVAAQVEVFRAQDAQKGVKVAQVLEGFIGRKVVKQTVMTVVYGVTLYGGRLQIEKRLRELPTFPQVFVWEASRYLVHLVFKSLREMFSGTRTIQHWLTQSARLISQAGSAVEWVTPLGIPIIQPYHRESKLVIRGGLQSVTWNSSVDSSQQPNTLKQKNGFPPNFIHSLDSCHMMLTALHCYRKGLTFVSVHDCFWTHACDVSFINEVCREQFVRLHSQPILEDLAAFLERRFCREDEDGAQAQGDTGHSAKLLEMLRAVPQKGDFDLQQVKGSTYFFS